jgi:hypothetical protein
LSFQQLQQKKKEKKNQKKEKENCCRHGRNCQLFSGRVKDRIKRRNCGSLDDFEGGFMAFIQTFRDLQVYQLARTNTQKIFLMTCSFPAEENMV